ncbi:MULTISPECIES: hypothetical protein [unclassified Bartonella]|uniref:hypothetical protein n=2 Tax=Bartonella TaxID=773 RepID=UPI0035D03EBE
MTSQKQRIFQARAGIKMFQNHNSIGQNNTEQNKGRQNNNEISSSHSKTRQHRPFCSHHKSVFPTQGPPQAPPAYPPIHTPTGLQHAPPPHRHIHPTLLAPPSSFPPSSFSQGATSPCSWQTNINTAISEGLSESQAHWQAKKFRDHWQEKSGKEALKVDWQAP